MVGEDAVHADVQFEKLTTESMLNKNMRSQFITLKEKNTILINQECHNNIIETILTRSHHDCDEYISSIDDNFQSDNNSVIDDDKF